MFPKVRIPSRRSIVMFLRFGRSVCTDYSVRVQDNGSGDRNTGLKVKNMQCYFSNQKSPWLIATDARISCPKSAPRAPLPLPVQTVFHLFRHSPLRGQRVGKRGEPDCTFILSITCSPCPISSGRHSGCTMGVRFLSYRPA